MKPAGTADRTLIDIARKVRPLERRAVREYRPVVDDILRSGSRDAARIERTLDGMLDFCDHAPMLALYKALCRHYWTIDPEAAVSYVQAYRERWDCEERGSGE
ncbi:MAG: hypothetical protein IPM99_19940 [Rubrivivax sp.]|nr:hypothetical protein [Rubrivivax sp.]